MSAAQRDATREWRTLGRPLTGRWVDISSFPLDVGDLEQRDVVFESDSIEIAQTKIILHRLTKILDGDAQRM